MSVAGSTPPERAAAAVSRTYAAIDWFITDPAVAHDPDALRRARVLVVCSAVFSLPACLFFQQTATQYGFPGLLSVAFLSVALFCLSIPFLLRLTRSTKVSGTVLTFTTLFFDLFIAYTSGGFEVSALLWVTPVPLMGAFFVGGRAGLTTAAVVCAALAGAFTMEQAGYPFPALPSPAETNAWFALLSLMNVTFFAAAIGWLYEKQAARGVRQLYNALQETHAALQARESHYRALTEEASDAIFVSTADGRFVEVNARACELTGYTRDELLSMTPDALLSAASLAERPPALARLADGSVVRHERELVRKDGAPLTVDVSLRFVQGGLLQAIARDMTARKRYEAELVAAKERAEEMHRLKSTFLANMSHEIRTPLTSILGFAEILMDDVPETSRAFAELILRNGHRLMGALNSVLDLAQMEGGTLQLRREPVDLSARVREAVQLLQPLASERGLCLEAEAPATPTTVVLDPSAFDRVLTNLISNAVKFTEQGGITVRVRPAPEEAVVEVQDTGIGIAPAFLPYLFDEFQQESKGFRRSYEGVGLGLTITRRLVEMMHGRISVASTQGAGSTFTIRFPLA